jgi:transcriptional regulator with XRE-family HTH domain
MDKNNNEVAGKGAQHAHPVDVYVGKRLRLKRTLLGLSQESIGKAIGVTFQQIQKYERGINRMGASRLYDFARALGVSVSYFFEGFGEDAASTYGVYGMAEGEASTFEYSDPTANRETMEMMRAFGRIKNPVQRKRVLELVRAMAAETESAA